MNYVEKTRLWERELSNAGYEYTHNVNSIVVKFGDLKDSLSDNVVCRITGYDDFSEILFKCIYRYDGKIRVENYAKINAFNGLMADRHYFLNEKNLCFAFVCPDSKIGVDYLLNFVFSNHCTRSALKNNLELEEL